MIVLYIGILSTFPQGFPQVEVFLTPAAYSWLFSQAASAPVVKPIRDFTNPTMPLVLPTFIDSRLTPSQSASRQGSSGAGSSQGHSRPPSSGKAKNVRKSKTRHHAMLYRPPRAMRPEAFIETLDEQQLNRYLSDQANILINEDDKHYESWSAAAVEKLIIMTLVTDGPYFEFRGDKSIYLHLQTAAGTAAIDKHKSLFSIFCTLEYGSALFTRHRTWRHRSYQGAYGQIWFYCSINLKADLQSSGR